MAVTIRQVAQVAGVTPTVVSHVLHQKAASIRVSEATAERVRKAAKDLGYRVNVLARGFRERHTMMLGVLHGIGFGRPRFDSGPRYFASLMDGVIDGAFEHGYSVTFCPKLLGSNQEAAIADGRFDGLIWYSTVPSGENAKMLEACSVPIVLTHMPSPELLGKFPSVRCDNERGIGLAIDHLFQLGHRRIGFALEHEDRFSEASIRRDAFFAHSKRLGLSLGQDDIVDINLDRSGISGYFEGSMKHTAILSANDGVASAFIRSAHQYGIRVPEDLSVVGFDSTSFCNEQRPALTSVYQPLVNMGRRAVDSLVSLINGEAIDPFDLVLPCSLDLRASTAPPSGDSI